MFANVLSFKKTSPLYGFFIEKKKSEIGSAIQYLNVGAHLIPSYGVVNWFQGWMYGS